MPKRLLDEESKTLGKLDETYQLLAGVLEKSIENDRVLHEERETKRVAITKGLLELAPKRLLAIALMAWKRFPQSAPHARSRKTCLTF